RKQRTCPGARPGSGQAHLGPGDGIRHAVAGPDQQAPQAPQGPHEASSRGRAHHGAGHARSRRPGRGPEPDPGPAHHRTGAAPAEFGPAADELIRVRRRMKATPAETIGTRTFPALGTFASLLVTDRRSMELAFGLLAAELLAMDMACS